MTGETRRERRERRDRYQIVAAYLCLLVFLGLVTAQSLGWQPFGKPIEVPPLVYIALVSVVYWIVGLKTPQWSAVRKLLDLLDSEEPRDGH